MVRLYGNSVAVSTADHSTVKGVQKDLAAASLGAVYAGESELM